MPQHCSINYNEGVYEELESLYNSTAHQNTLEDIILLVALDGERKVDKGEGVVVIAITGKKGKNTNMITGKEYTCWKGGIRLVLTRMRIGANGVQHLQAIGVYHEKFTRKEYSKHLRDLGTDSLPGYGLTAPPCKRSYDPDWEQAFHNTCFV